MNDPRNDPLPTNPAKKPQRFIRDLAWGFFNGHWQNEFLIQYADIPSFHAQFLSRNSGPLGQYIMNRWENRPPDARTLISSRFLEYSHESGDPHIQVFRLTDKGLSLAGVASAASVFISYRRSESTSFAMLIVCRMKEYGSIPFLDEQPDRDDQAVALKLGRPWRLDLKDAIEKRDTVIALIGPTTLQSLAVRQELDWALAANKDIIPVWHNQFQLDNSDHVPSELHPDIRAAVTEGNAVHVETERPSQYEMAITRLLSNFHLIT